MSRGQHQGGRVLAEILTQFGDDRLGPVARLPMWRLAQGFLKWLPAHGYAETTVAAYRDALEIFLGFAQARGLEYPDQATVLACDAFYAWLQSGGASASTRSHRRAVLISWWKWMEHEGFAERNVPQKTYPIRVPKPLPKYLEPHQIDDFVARLATLPDLLGRRDHAIIATFFYEGPRVAELVALQVDDVDLQAGRVRINAGKGGKGRAIYLAPRLRPILADYLEHVRPRLLAMPVHGWLHRTARDRTWLMSYKVNGRRVMASTKTQDKTEAQAILADRTRDVRIEQQSPYLFVRASRTGAHFRTKAGHPLRTRAVYRIIRDRAREILGVRLSPHKLRHTCASYLIYHGASPETVQRLLGHQDVKTTMIYMHLPQRKQEEELARIFGAGS